MSQYNRIARALVAWGSFVLGTAAAALVTAAVDPDGGPLVRVLRALAVLVVVLAVLAVLHRRDRGVLALARARSAWLGAGVVLAAAALTFGVDHLAGGVTVTVVDPVLLVEVLLVSTLLAAAQEAVPEELALRGSVLGSLREVAPTAVAVAASTALFALAPAAGITLAAVLGELLGVRTPGPALAPAGQDPVTYLVLLVCFGTMLAVARLATGSVWTGVGAHLTVLAVNRSFLGEASDTGLQVQAAPGSEVLVLVYLALATVGLLLVGRHRRRSGRAGAVPAAAAGTGSGKAATPTH